jgi:hypothetical protein
MSCDLETYKDDIVDAITAKYAECECTLTPYLPSNLDTLCGDGDGLFTELHTAWNALVSDCGMFPTLTDPGAPPDCVDEEWLGDFLEYISTTTCECEQEEPEIVLVRPYDDYTAYFSIPPSSGTFPITFKYEFRRATRTKFELWHSRGAGRLYEIIVDSPRNYTDVWSFWEKQYLLPLTWVWYDWKVTAWNACGDMVETETRRVSWNLMKPDCTPGSTRTLASWTVQYGQPEFELWPYRFDGDAGGRMWKHWRVVKGGQSATYLWGYVDSSRAELMGLPYAFLHPEHFGYHPYPGFMRLELVCW